MRKTIKAIWEYYKMKILLYLWKKEMEDSFKEMYGKWKKKGNERKGDGKMSNKTYKTIITTIVTIGIIFGTLNLIKWNIE